MKVNYNMIRSFIILMKEAQGFRNKSVFLAYIVNNFLNGLCNYQRFQNNNDIFIEFRGARLWFGPFAAELSSYIEIYVKKEYELDPDFIPSNDDVVFDVGANIGLYTVRQAMRAKNGRIFSFEPNPYTFARLEKNIRENGLYNVFCFNKALYSKRCEVELNPCVHSTKTSILGKDDTFSDDTLSHSRVEAIVLDDVVQKWGIEKINLMKIDVEGSEIEVLKGAGKSLKLTDKIIMECHSERLEDQAKNFLQAKGFRIGREVRKGGPFSLIYFTKG